MGDDVLFASFIGCAGRVFVFADNFTEAFFHVVEEASMVPVGAVFEFLDSVSGEFSGIRVGGGLVFCGEFGLDEFAGALNAV